jgi:hypothetical protein
LKGADKSSTASYKGNGNYERLAYSSGLWLEFLENEMNMPLKAAEIIGKARVREEREQEEKKWEQAARDSKKGGDSRTRTDRGKML